MKKILALIIAVVMMVACFTACGGQAQTEATAFKIGGTGPLTGTAAIYGNAVKNAAEIAVEEINAKGGIQLELKYEDDAHDAEKAVSAYNSLKDWGMQIFLGSVTSKPCEATVAEAANDNYFLLTPSASSTAVIKDNDVGFQMCFTDPNQGSASAQYISDKGLGKKIAVIYKSDDVYSTGVLETFKAKAAELKLQIVSETAFADGADTDFTAQLKDAQDKGADLVFLPMYYTPAYLIISQANQMGYAPTWFGVDGMDGVLTIEGADTSLVEGVMLLTPFNADSTDEKTAAFVKKYQEKFGEVPNQFAADAYDCVYAIAQALENAKATYDMDNVKLLEVLKEQFTSMKFDGLTGDGMTWDTDGAVTKSPKGMIIKDAAYVGLD